MLSKEPTLRRRRGSCRHVWIVSRPTAKPFVIGELPLAIRHDLERDVGSIRRDMDLDPHAADLTEPGLAPREAAVLELFAFGFDLRRWRFLHARAAMAF